MKFIVPVLFFVLILGSQLIFPNVYADINSTAPTAAGNAAAANTSSGDPFASTSNPEWVPDRDVTFAGKTANRAQDLFKWVIQEHRWSSIQATDSQNPFSQSFVEIRNIVYVLLTLFILATAFLIILTRGQNITVVKFIPRFLLVLFLVTFSFSLVQFIYQVTDVAQGFFLDLNKDPKRDPDFISSEDLLHINFVYDQFKGFRKPGFFHDESVFISVLLVKLTALTYYAMATVLLLRKVILWFFIVLSPIFPLLLLYFPVRNAGKIWLGEFFRWLLYGPLFAILLSGLVLLWQRWKAEVPVNLTSIQFVCAESSCNKDIPKKYPTSINILLGGPNAYVNRDTQSSLNTDGNFAQYWIALLMLWMVIILPFILLKIFLDNLREITLSGDNALIQYLAQRGAPLMNRYGFNPPGPKPPPSFLKPAGQAMALPIFKQAQDENSIESRMERALAEGIENQNRVSISRSRSFNQPVFSSSSLHSNQSVSNEEQILKLTNISIPTMRDIVSYETQIINNNLQISNQLNQNAEILRRISNTSTIVTPQERQHYTQVKATLQQASQSGSAVAANILAASHANSSTPLPEVNKIQQLSLEEYETVKKMWRENYQKLQPPKDKDGKEVSRKDWVKSEEKKIEEAINLLSSSDPQKQKEGKEMVSKVLPFLLLGGFSKEEIVSYLKAKRSAAKETAEEMAKEESEKDQLLEVDRQKTAEKVMHATAEMELPEAKEKK